MKNRTFSPAPPPFMPTTTLSDFLGGTIASEVAWPYIRMMIIGAIQETFHVQLRMMPWPAPRHGWLHWPRPRFTMPIVAKGNGWLEVELARLMAGNDPLRALCDMIATHWARTITRDIEAELRRLPASGKRKVKIFLSIEETFKGARIPRPLWDAILAKPKLRTRGPAIELMPGRMLARITYAFKIEAES